MVRHPRRALRPGRLAIHPGPRRPIAPPIGLNQPPPRRRFAENKRTTPNLPHRLAGPSARRGRDGAIGWTPGPPPLKKGGGGRDKGASCCPRTLSCARVRGACGTINLSSDDALAALLISCRSRARSREGYSRGWAEAHPHPGPYRVAGQSHSARLLPFSPLSFPRKRESSAPTPVTRPWIPACAGMAATERSESPNWIALLEAVAVDAR